MDFIRDAGWGIYPVLFFGVFGVVVALRHATEPRRDRLALVAGLAIATVLLGMLGAVTGMQTSAAGYSAAGTPPLHLFLVGLREASNNMVAALLFAVLQTLVATYGTVRAYKAELTREA